MNLPAGQSVQAVAPDAVLYWPAGQMEQSSEESWNGADVKDAATLLYRPGGQLHTPSTCVNKRGNTHV